jgi:mono/diheme cytochrome c family protein
VTFTREIKGAIAGGLTSLLILIVTFVAAGIYKDRRVMEDPFHNSSLAAQNLPAKGRTLFFQSCAHCHGRDADGGEDAPSLHKLQISGAHMALVIKSGIKGEMPTFSKKYSDQDIATIVAYLKTLN